jgi:hypothetical protein
MVEEQILWFVFVPSMVEEQILWCLRSFDSLVTNNSFFFVPSIVEVQIFSFFFASIQKICSTSFLKICCHTVWCGRMLTATPASTKNCCFLLSSCRKIMLPPRVFSSRRPGCFPSTDSQACISWPCCRSSVIETDLTVVLVWAECLPVAALLAAQGAVLSLLVAGREILVTPARNFAYGSIILHVDGGDGASGSAAV